MIDTENLKTTLFDLATSGRLTSYYPSKDSIDEILCKIPEPSVKRKRLLQKEYQYGKLYEIPSNWKWVRLGEISSYGDTPEKVTAEDCAADTWLLELEDIESGGKIIKKTTVSDKKSIGEKTAFSSGQILYSKLRPYLKKVLIADEDGISTPELISFDVFAGIDSRYIRYCLLNTFTNKAIDNRSYGVKMPRVDTGFMVNLPIPLPPVSEQIYISDKVEAALYEIDILTDTQARYEKDKASLKSKVIDVGIQGKLTEQLPEDGNAENLYKKIVEEKEEILIARNGRKDKNIMPVGTDVPFTIPKNWKWLRLGDIGFFKKGPFGSALTKSMFVPKGHDTVKVYEQQHAIKKNKKLGTYYIKRDYFESKMRGFEVRPGDIIVSCAGTIGESYIMPDDIEQGIINQALMRVTLVPSVNKRFFQYYFDSNLKQLAQINGNGSAITNIPPFEVLKNWYFPLPPVSEQIRIVDKISEILDQI